MRPPDHKVTEEFTDGQLYTPNVFKLNTKKNQEEIKAFRRGT